MHSTPIKHDSVQRNTKIRSHGVSHLHRLLLGFYTTNWLTFAAAFAVFCGRDGKGEISLQFYIALITINKLKRAELLKAKVLLLLNKIFIL